MTGILCPRRTTVEESGQPLPRGAGSDGHVPTPPRHEALLAVPQDELDRIRIMGG